MKMIILLAICISTISVLTACEGMLPVNPNSGGTSSSSTTSQTPILAQRSPGILEIVYLEKGVIWIWKENQPGPRQLSISGLVEDLKISDDGTMLAYKEAGQLYGSTLDNNGYIEDTFPLIDQQFLSGLSPEPGSKAMIDVFDFENDKENNEDKIIYVNTYVLGSIGNGSLLRVNATKKTITRIIAPGEAGFFDVSPDGQKLVVTRANALIISEWDGSSPRVVLRFPDYSGFSTIYQPEIFWQDDGFSLVVPGMDSQGRMSGLQTFIKVDRNGSITRRVDLTIPSPFHVFLSPDGTKISYLWDHGDLADLFITEVDRDPIHANIILSYPRKDIGIIGWANDSNHIVFWLKSEDEKLFTEDKPLVVAIGEKCQYLVTLNYDPKSTIRWVDNSRLLFMDNANNLRVGSCLNAVCDSNDNGNIAKLSCDNEFFGSRCIYDYSLLH